MSDTAFAELTKTATSLEYARRVELLNLLAQSLYDDIPSREEAENGLDEAIREVERGEYTTYGAFGELLSELDHEA